MSEGDKATECIVYVTNAPVASRSRALKAVKNWGKIEDEEMREFALKQSREHFSTRGVLSRR